MASRSEIARQDQATEQRRTDACAALVDHVRQPIGDEGIDTSRGIAVGVLGALIEAIEGEADDITELRRKGWQGKAREHQVAAQVVKEWRDALVAWTPPALPAPPAEIAVSNRAATPAELEARLEAAFGPNLAPVRHIRTVIKEIEYPDGVGMRTDVAYGALCGAKGGTWTTRSATNCEDCIANHDHEHGPYTGPVAYNGGDPLPTDPPTIERRDGPVTPAVARELREAVDNERELNAAYDALTTDAENAQVREALTAEMQYTSLAYVEAPPREAMERIMVMAQAPMPNIVEPPPRRPHRLRLTAAQVREHGLSRARGAEHRSVSQVTGYADCGTRYALGDLEIPAWWNVGGKAFHACAEEINRAAYADRSINDLVGDGDTHELMWLRNFEVEIGRQEATTPDHHRDTWRAANRKSEHYDWWRVEGPPMVSKYVVWLQSMLQEGWSIATVPSRSGLAMAGPIVPVIEYETRLNVGTAVPNLSIIDLALVHPPLDAVLIVDFKAGSSAPKDTFQLGVYGWAALGAGIAQQPAQVRGAYYRARVGELTPQWPVLDFHPWPDIVQRYRDTDAAERAGIYTPNVTTFCGGCGVRDLCPAQRDQ